MNAVELAPGLWGWTARHPAWQPGDSWDEGVWCWYVELDDATAVVDPLVPEDDAARFWRNLDADVARRARPVCVLLTTRQHRRNADAIAARYDGRICQVADELPRGIATFPVEHPKPVERPLWFEAHHALAFGDALEVRQGELRVWWDERWHVSGEWYEQRLLPSLRRLAELPIEHVLASHGGAVPGSELRAALARPPVR